MNLYRKDWLSRHIYKSTSSFACVFWATMSWEKVIHELYCKWGSREGAEQRSNNCGSCFSHLATAWSCPPLCLFNKQWMKSRQLIESNRWFHWLKWEVFDSTHWLQIIQWQKSMHMQAWSLFFCGSNIKYQIIQYSGWLWVKWEHDLTLKTV